MAKGFPSFPKKKMKYTNIKNTNIQRVSRLCFGTGFGKYKGHNLLVVAYKKYGINFWDTADCYKSQKELGEALEIVGRDNIAIMTKVDSTTQADTKRLIKKALKEMKTHYIDIVLLHGIQNMADFKRRKPALKVLLDYKDKGIIKAVGFSTHSSPEAVKEAPKEIDIILASINEERIDRGTKEDMIEALKSQKKKGIIAMKVLGAGKHINQYKKRMDFAIKHKFIDCLNIGMKSEAEIKQNAAYVYKHYK